MLTIISRSSGETNQANAAAPLMSNAKRRIKMTTPFNGETVSIMGGVEGVAGVVV